MALSRRLKADLSDLLEVLAISSIGVAVFGAVWCWTELAALAAIVSLLICLARVLTGQPDARFPLHRLDVAVAAVVVCLLPAAFRSLSPNALWATRHLLLMAATYVSVRAGIRRAFQRRVLLIVTSVVACAAAGRALYDFVQRAAQARALGFQDLVNFRALMRLGVPQGLSLGAWSSTFLALIPFVLVLRLRSTSRVSRGLLVAIEILLIGAILLTFQRGVYIGLAWFFLSCVLGAKVLAVRGPRLGILLGPLVTAVTFTAITPAGPSMLTTVGVVHSAIGVRSLEARTSLWGAALPLLSSHPRGMGRGMLPFVTSQLEDRRLDRPYVSQVFSTPLQIAVEEGLLGIAAASALLVAFVWVSVGRCRRRGASRAGMPVLIFLAGVLSVVVRDLSYSSLLLNPGCAVLVAAMCGMNARLPRTGTTNVWKPVVFVSVSALALCLVQWRCVERVLAERHLGKAIAALERHDDEGAEKAIDSALLRAPRDPNLWSHKGLVGALRAGLSLKATPTGGVDLGVESGTYLEDAVHAYREAAALSPDDYLIQRNMGALLWASNEPDRALACFRRAATVGPPDPLTDVLTGLVLESQGDSSAALVEYRHAVSVSPDLLQSAFFDDFRARSVSGAMEVVRSAITDVRQKLDGAFDPIAAARLGAMLLETEPRQARGLLERAASEVPNLSRPWLNLARLHASAGDDVTSRLYCERAVWLEPTDSSAWVVLAGVRERGGDTAGALVAYARALKSAAQPGHPKRAWFLYHSTSVRNDVVPGDLVTYCAPRTDTGAAISNRLRALCQGRNSLECETL
jgi:tetratricopeptide (TPR) repeat protein